MQLTHRPKSREDRKRRDRAVTFVRECANRVIQLAADTARQSSHSPRFQKLKRKMLANRHPMPNHYFSESQRVSLKTDTDPPSSPSSGCALASSQGLPPRKNSQVQTHDRITPAKRGRATVVAVSKRNKTKLPPIPKVDEAEFTEVIRKMVNTGPITRKNVEKRQNPHRGPLIPPIEKRQPQ